MGEHDAGVVGVPGDPTVGHRLRHRLCQPAAIGQLTSGAVPAWETRFLPSTVTAGRRTERLLCTFKEASSWVVWLP